MSADIIDVHAHIVPEHIPQEPLTNEARWPCICHGSDDTANVMIGDKVFREIDHRSWDGARRIADMDRSGVARQVLSPMPELLSYWFAPSTGLTMCQWMNHTIAELVARYPQRFSGLGGVPLQDTALAARYLSDLKASGLVGVELGSNINGMMLGDASLDEFYAEAERLDLAIFVHALHPIGAERLKATPELIPFAAFPLDTALSLISLIRQGVPERYPRLRFGFSHGGGAVIPLAHRLGQGAALTGNFGGTLSKSPAQYAAGFFYDSLVYDTGYLGYLANEFAPGQVFCGTDYPYSIMESDPDGFIARSPVHDDASVRHGAARRFLNL